MTSSNVSSLARAISMAQQPTLWRAGATRYRQMRSELLKERGWCA
jgi:hypothetical protein